MNYSTGKSVDYTLDTPDDKSEYYQYHFYCFANGDRWAEKYRAYTFEEWQENGCPSHPGKNDEFCVKL